MAVESIRSSEGTRSRPNLAPAGAILTLVSALVTVLGAGIADAARPGHSDLGALPQAFECPDPAGTTPAEQRSCGEEIYRTMCWECHEEEDGSGTILDPELLASYNNAWAVFDYVSYSMPEDDPGILPEADYWAVTAYLLASRDLLADEDLLTPETAESVELGN